MRVIILLLCSCLLSACTAGGLIRAGAGNTIYSSDIAGESTLQEAYFGILCRDNGLPVISDGQRPLCNYAAMGPGHWAIMTNAGLYDIDRRCDDYLEWLHEARQTRGPLSNQLVKTGTATTALLRLLDVGSVTIDIIGLAFGYAQDSFTSFNPDLLFAVEGSTVQSLVLNRQLEAKREIHALTFSNKPQVMHALRGYLRLCMPFTIETDINTTLSAAARGQAIPGALVSTGPAATGAAMEPLTATRPVTLADQPAAPPPVDAVRAVFTVPEGKSVADVVQVQSYLCDPQPDGRVGPNTRRVIHILEDYPDAAGYVMNGKLDPTEHNAVLGFGGACDLRLFRNSYERLVLGDAAQYGAVRDVIKRHLPNDALPDGPYSAAVQDQLRARLVQLRALPGVFDDALVPRDELSRSVWHSILNLP